MKQEKLTKIKNIPEKIDKFWNRNISKSKKIQNRKKSKSKKFKMEIFQNRNISKFKKQNKRKENKQKKMKRIAQLTIKPARSATLSLSTPVIKIPSPYSTPPLIIKPSDWPGSMSNSTFRMRSRRSCFLPPYSTGGEVGRPWRSIQEHVCLDGWLYASRNGGPNPCNGAVELIIGGARTVMLICRDDFKICTHRYMRINRTKQEKDVDRVIADTTHSMEYGLLNGLRTFLIQNTNHSDCALQRFQRCKHFLCSYRADKKCSPPNTPAKWCWPMKLNI